MSATYRGHIELVSTLYMYNQRFQVLPIYKKKIQIKYNTKIAFRSLTFFFKNWSVNGTGRKTKTTTLCDWLFDCMVASFIG